MFTNVQVSTEPTHRPDGWTHPSVSLLPYLYLLVCLDLMYPPCFCQLVFISPFVHLPLNALVCENPQALRLDVKLNFAKERYLFNIQTSDRVVMYLSFFVW